MKNKIVMIAAFLAVMVVMTGIAAASTHIAGTVYDADKTTPYLGATVKAYSDAARTILVGSATSDSNGEYDIDYSGTLTHVYIKATAPGKEGLSDGVPILGNINSKFYLIDVNFIPEFPTVALPVAAVLGLVFFFQHRKKKEE